MYFFSYGELRLNESTLSFENLSWNFQFFLKWSLDESFILLQGYKEWALPWTTNLNTVRVKSSIFVSRAGIMT